MSPAVHLARCPPCLHSVACSASGGVHDLPSGRLGVSTWDATRLHWLLAAVPCTSDASVSGWPHCNASIPPRPFPGILHMTCLLLCSLICRQATLSCVNMFYERLKGAAGAHAVRSMPTATCRADSQPRRDQQARVQERATVLHAATPKSHCAAHTKPRRTEYWCWFEC